MKKCSQQNNNNNNNNNNDNNNNNNNIIVIIIIVIMIITITIIEALNRRCRTMIMYGHAIRLNVLGVSDIICTESGL